MANIDDKHTSPQSVANVTPVAMSNASYANNNPMVADAMKGAATATTKTLLLPATSSSTATTATLSSSTTTPLAANRSLQVPNPVSSLQPTPVKEVSRENTVLPQASLKIQQLPPSQSVAVPGTVAAPASTASTNIMYHRLPPNTSSNTTPSLLTSNLPPQQTNTSTLPSTKNSSKKKKNSISLNTAQSVSSSGSVQGENTGRWTAEEHRLFLQGLEQHGKGWKKIASLIKSRTVVQIRTHAQKYFQKIAKARQNGEDGEVSMENRDSGAASSSSGVTKRKKSGNKRKAIASVVESAVVEGKKLATDKTKKMASMVGSADDVVPLDFVAPSLTPYLHTVPCTASGTGELTEGRVTPTESTTSHGHSVPSIASTQGIISAAALEDSL
jgi:myb-like DNA-binding domain, SHAQKYF class